MPKEKKFFLRLFWTTFSLSAFTFGGGFVIIPLMRHKFVEQNGWIKEEEMLDLTAIAQSAPGSIAVNASILVGYRLAGIRGAAVSIFGTILPPFTILSIISFFYRQFRDNALISAMMIGMQAAIVAVIFDVVLRLLSNLSKQKEAKKKILSLILLAASFVASYFFKVNVVILILVCALIGAADTLWENRKKKC